jgi:hypothetical protein
MSMRLSDGDADELLSKTAKTLEIMTNLTFLTAFDADQPEKVRRYMSLADEELKSLVRVLRKHLRHH